LVVQCTHPFNQAWIEASTKGAVLIFAASEIEERTMKTGLSPAVAGLLGGMGGGIAQAYATMGESAMSNGIHFEATLLYDAYDFFRLTASAAHNVASN
jgi:hypothetical protein